MYYGQMDTVVYLFLAFKEQALKLLEHSNEELVLEVEALREKNGSFNTSVFMWCRMVLQNIKLPSVETVLSERQKGSLSALTGPSGTRAICKVATSIL
jgi:hypothetical protein